MKNYGKAKKKRKGMICKPEMSSRVGYAWEMYEHPHNACPKTVPLIE